MNETQPNQADSEQVIVALEGDAGNLDKLVTLLANAGSANCFPHWLKIFRRRKPRRSKS